MSHHKHTFLAVAGLMLLATTVIAQPRNRFDDDHYRRYGGETLNHVRGDLDRAASRTSYLNEREVRRINFVRERLGEFQRKWERGRYDGRDLTEAISGLRELVDRAPLRPRDRENLSDDLRRLHAMRERYDRRQ